MEMGKAAHAQNGKYQKHGEMVQGNPHLVRRTLEGHSRPPGQMERLLPVLCWRYRSQVAEIVVTRANRVIHQHCTAQMAP